MFSWRVLYETVMILMILTYGILIVAPPDKHPLLTPDFIQMVDWGVIAFFAVEYAFRLWRAEKKWAFVLHNWIDLIAMIPIDPSFRLGRLLRVVRLVALMKASPKIWGVLKSKQMMTIFTFASVVMIWSSTGIYFLEEGVNPSIRNYSDALWWAIVTTTTVGYGDISPVSPGGRIIAVFLMLTGIGVIGSLTATLANHWFDFTPKHDMHSSPHAPNRVRESLKKQVADWIHHIEVLSEHEYQTMLHSLEMLRRTDQEAEPVQAEIVKKSE